MLSSLKTFIIISVLLAALVFAAADEPETDSVETDDKNEGNDDGSLRYEDSVLVLGSDNFEEAINDNSIILVEFYAPWCGHCKSLAPEYAAAAKELASNEPPVVLAKVDATVHNELAKRFDVEGYPTLKFFKNGVKYDYDGPRFTSGIVEYMKERALPTWEPEPDAVVTLTQENFDDFVDSHELLLVEFYAPWCGHCKKLAPTYEKAAKTLLKNDPPIPLAKVDATKDTELALKYQIEGYPTLKIFRKGNPSPYNGKTDSEYDIVVFMKNQVGDGAKVIKNVKALKDFFSVDDITVVGFFESQDNPLLKPYKDVADEIRDEYAFGVTYDEEPRKAYKIPPNSVVVFNAERFYTKYEQKWYILNVKSDTTANDVKEFISKHSLPLVGHYFRPQINRYENKRPLCLVFYSVDFSFDHREATQFWRVKVASIARKFSEITFAVADDETNAKLMEDFGLADSGEEINIGIFGADNKKYRMELLEEFDTEEIIEFLNKFKKGKLKPHIKSQRAPKKQTGPVTVVVANTFNEIVLNPKKDVLIELYAPWCGHCKKLEPIYAELAKKLKSEKNLVIAKLDATANDLPDSYSASGYPTIYFAPANGKNSPVKYEGERDLNGFEKFLKEHATVTFDKIGKDEL